MSGPLFITGHAGLLGSALVRQAAAAGTPVLTASRAELDLANTGAVEAFLKIHRPAAIIHAAARNAGIALHEAEPAGMLADNFAVACGVLSAAARAGIPRLLYVSSAAVYAGGEGVPSPEAASGTVVPGGPTAGYAIAKIAGMMLCEAIRREHGLLYHSIIPCNLYGAGDNYHPAHATVVAGMIRRIHTAIQQGEPEFAVWGSGRQTREFLHVEDLATACFHLLADPDPPPRVNCSPGVSTPLLELAERLKSISGFTGDIHTDPSKPEGAGRPALDGTLLRSRGWAPRISLAQGLAMTWDAFLAARLAGTLRGG